MSFWGATVITSLASAIPVVGDNLVTWLWGGLSVDLATLNRFFSLHYLLPVIILGSSIVHIGTLHHYGSSNPLGIAKPVDAGAFFTYFILKDLVLWSLQCILPSSLSFVFIFEVVNYSPGACFTSDRFHCWG